MNTGDIIEAIDYHIILSDRDHWDVVGALELIQHSVTTRIEHLLAGNRDLVHDAIVAAGQQRLDEAVIDAGYLCSSD
jgi:hypothetical protein